MPDAIYQQLFATIKSRKRARADQSYTAQLFAAGVPKIAKKLSEETAETVIEAVRGDKARLRDMIANRADREDRFYVQGDPRGTYGGYMPPEFPKGNGNA